MAQSLRLIFKIACTVLHQTNVYICSNFIITLQYQKSIDLLLTSKFYTILELFFSNSNYERYCLQKTLIFFRYAIKKSRLYFEKRLEFTKILEAQKATILCLEAEVRQKKNDYTTSLRNLERISERIHEERSTGSLESAVSSDQEDQKSDFKSSESLPGNPPPYAPTAPPPYEDKYIIDKVRDYTCPDRVSAIMRSLLWTSIHVGRTFIFCI